MRDMYEGKRNIAKDPVARKKRVVTHMTKPEISSVSPFFIVHNGAAALSFYREQLNRPLNRRPLGGRSREKRRKRA